MFLDVIPEIVPVRFGVAIVIGIVCKLLVAVLDDVNVISPLHLPWRLKEKPTGRDRLAVPDSLIVAQTPNLSEVPVVVDFALIDPFVHAWAFDMFRVKLIAPNEKFLVIDVLFTVNESVPER